MANPHARKTANDHWARLERTMAGEMPDHPPVSLWHHFPVIDQTPEGLTEATVNWQRRFDFDLVKFMPTGTYSIEDWGARTDYVENEFGIRRVLEFGIKGLGDWEKLGVLDPGAAYLGMQIEALRQTAKALDGEVPILQTIFSPLTTALKLAGHDAVMDAIRQAPDAFESALAVIAETTDRFVQASIEAGCHGVFFATQGADSTVMTREEYARFGVPFDLQVANGAVAGLDFRMMHIHGTHAYFDMFLDYPVNMLNWHDRLAGPTLTEGREKFAGTVVGGVNEQGAISGTDPEAALREFREGRAEIDAPRTVVTPGCVLPVVVDEDVIDAVLNELRA